MADKEILTITEVAEYLRVGEESIRVLIRQGRLFAVKVGREYRIKRADLDSFMATTPQEHK